MYFLKKAYRIEDQRHNVAKQVFVVEDPRKDGYRGKFEQGVSLDYDWATVHVSPHEACLGRAADHSKRFKVFRFRSDLNSAGYEFVPGKTVVFASWKDYLEPYLIPPNPEEIDEKTWFDYLDRVDEESRKARDLKQLPAAPKDKTRDGVAAWLAERHFLVDTGVHEIRYLPQGAPAEEIRLLEVNDRFLGLVGEGRPEAIDFGLDVKGIRFRLFVADISSEQLKEMERDPSLLPVGWSFDEAKVWRRGA